MIRRIIAIRFIQMFRSTKGVGLHRMIFLFLAIIIALVVTFFATKSSINSLYTTALYGLIIVIIQLKRIDYKFILVHIEKRYLLNISEYSLLASPLLLSLLFHQQWVSVLVLISIIIVIPFLRITLSVRTINTIFQKLIPANHFEWKSGVRGSIFYMIPIYLVGLIFSHNIAVIPIVVIVLSLIIFSFYSVLEPLSMIILFQKGAHTFLTYKIVSEMVIYNIFLLPFIVSFSVLHFEYSYLLLILVVCLNLLLIYSVLSKYILIPLKNSQPISSSIQTIGLLGVFLPLPFIFINLLLSIKFYYKASSQLKPFLNDYN